MDSGWCGAWGNVMLVGARGVRWRLGGDSGVKSEKQVTREVTRRWQVTSVVLLEDRWG